MQSVNDTFNYRPWLNDDGLIHSDPVLIMVSREWSAETWELFLVETVEGTGSYVRERQIDPWQYDAILDELEESIFAWLSSPESDDMQSILRRYIRDHLSPRQQQIIRLTYWEGYSERCIGEILSIERPTVAVQKRRSLKKLKDLIEKRSSDVTSSKRGWKKVSGG